MHILSGHISRVLSDVATVLQSFNDSMLPLQQYCIAQEGRKSLLICSRGTNNKYQETKHNIVKETV